MRRIFRLIKGLLIGGALLTIFVDRCKHRIVSDNTENGCRCSQIIDMHQALKFPSGWSFPMLYRHHAALPYPKSIVSHMRSFRSYIEQCPAKDPELLPKGWYGDSKRRNLSGRYPTKLIGELTRELAMEPIELGPLIGPDAESDTIYPSKKPSSSIAVLLHSEDAEFYKHSGELRFIYPRSSQYAR